MLIVENLDDAEKMHVREKLFGIIPTQGNVCWSHVHKFPSRLSSLPRSIYFRMTPRHFLALYRWGHLSSLCFFSAVAAPPLWPPGRLLRAGPAQALAFGENGSGSMVPGLLPLPSGSHVRGRPDKPPARPQGRAQADSGHLERGTSGRKHSLSRCPSHGDGKEHG